ncbi:acyl-CoA thioesterase [Robertkochia solimangrovi]|uniref:acyl-CoA thioesterase n=1 Tax=Robertkochia solimangrovi TaxID=2213046 RepID=UPI00117F3ED8|nr:thioesterase family protein [Robertkochia solimangrovi]TRZ45180.1 acyl-CoA thioesterase [Robertkochia solimangrovi]
MEIYEKEIEVTNDDIDDLGHVNNVRYLQWVQDIAGEHWQLRSDEAMRDRYIWMVISHNIHYKGQAFPGDIIQLKTFVTKASGVTSLRKVEMYLKDSGKLLVTAETVWCLLDNHSRKPARMPQEIIDLF